MKFEGRVEIHAPRPKVWAFVTDPDQIASCGPGVQSVEKIDDSHFRAHAKVGIGFISMKLVVNAEFLELHEPDDATVLARGQAPGSAVDATAKMSLTDGADGSTVMDWTADVEHLGNRRQRRRADDRGNRQQDDRPDLRLHQGEARSLTGRRSRSTPRPAGRPEASPRMELVIRAIGPLQTNVCLVGDPRTREAIVIDGAIPGLPWVVDELTRRAWRLILIVSTHGHWDHTGENAALQAWSREQAGAAARGDAAGADAAGAARADASGSEVAAGPGVSVAAGIRTAGTDADGGSAASGAGITAHRATGAEIAAHRADWHRLTDPQPLFAPFPIPPCVPAVELAEGGVVRFGDVRLDVLHTPGHTEGSVCLVAADEGILFSGDTLFAGGWGRVDLPGGDALAMADSLARLGGLEGSLRVVPGHGRETTIARERPWLELVARERRLPL